MFCYDIANPKRLSKVAKTLENYGIRIQKSFFQCEMERKNMIELRDALLKTIKRKKDSLFIYPICDDCNSKAIVDGNGNLLKISSFTII